MKKLFLFLIVAGFAFASCGKRPSSEQATCSKKEEGKCCSQTLVIEEEYIVFDDEDVEFVD